MSNLLQRPRGALPALALAALAAGASAAPPDHAVHSGRPAFSARVVPLLEEARSVAAVEVEVPYRELSFRRAGERLEARFDLIVLILQGERQVAGQLYPESLSVAGRAALYDTPSTYRREVLIPLAPGQYTVEVAVSEPASGHEGRVRLGLALQPLFPGDLRLSPILFGPCGVDLPFAEMFFDPRMVRQVRDPQTAFCAYAELFHPGRSPDSVRVTWTLSGEADPKGTVRQGTLSRPGGRGSTRLRWPLPVADLSLDNYRLEVTAAVDGRTARAETTLGVVLENEASIDRFFTTSLDALEIIAPEAEVEELRHAAPEERHAAWERFWARRDPSPGTARNEFKEEFFDRMRAADARFGVGRPGWRTDRGRIFIRYGEPDTIDRRPFQAGTPPTETWVYDAIGLRFVFVDENGYGDYRLVG